MRIFLSILGIFTSIGFINMMIKFIENVNRSRESEYPSDIVALVLLGIITFILFYYSSKPKKIKEKTTNDNTSYKNINLIQKVLSQVKKTQDKISDISLLSNKSWVLNSTNNIHEVWILRKDNTLLISKNGIVETGSWNYFIESKSLYLELGDEKKLFSQVIVDDLNLSIKLDGTDEIITFEDEVLKKSNDTEIVYNDDFISEKTIVEPTKEEVLKNTIDEEIISFEDGVSKNPINTEIVDNESIPEIISEPTKEQSVWFKLRYTKSFLKRFLLNRYEELICIINNKVFLFFLTFVLIISLIGLISIVILPFLYENELTVIALEFVIFIIAVIFYINYNRLRIFFLHIQHKEYRQRLIKTFFKYLFVVVSIIVICLLVFGFIKLKEFLYGFL